MSCEGCFQCDKVHCVSIVHDNAQKIIERQPDRRGVVVRMDAHTRISFKRPVEYNFDGGVRIVDNTERRHLSTDQPQISLQALRGRKAQSCRAELRFNRFKIGASSRASAALRSDI